MPFFVFPSLYWTIKPTVEIRERFESRAEKDFSSSSDDFRSDLYSRYRIGLDFKNKKGVNGRVAYQYSHDLSWQRSGNAGKVNSDLIEAYVEVPDSLGKVKAGRQILNVGSERLIASGDWGNSGRSWNMVRLTNSKWDAWVGQLAVNGSPSKDTLIGGISMSGSLGKTMLIYKHDAPSTGEIDLYTLDHRWTRSDRCFKYEIEAAGQAGRVGTNALLAWAGVGRVAYTMSPKVTAYVEADVASGGKHGNTLLTFDQLYPNNHGRYGIVDAQGWKNMKALAVGVTLNPTKKLSVTAEYDRFGLWAANDAWYSDGGKINKSGGTSFTDPTGSKGTDVGDELDLSGCFKVDARATLDAGIGVFRPGHYQRSFAGIGERNQMWGFVQVRFRF